MFSLIPAITTTTADPGGYKLKQNKWQEKEKDVIFIIYKMEFEFLHLKYLEKYIEIYAWILLTHDIFFITQSKIDFNLYLELCK